jgi:VCBS repeat-containing protein
MSHRSKFVQAGSITSANFASPSNQMDWLTTNSSLSVLYALTYRLDSLWVLINDSDVEGDTLTAELVAGPSHAQSFTLNSDGSFTYRHDGSETTSDSFTYRAYDGQAYSNIATVSLTINPINDPPVNTVPGNQTTSEDTNRVFSSANGNAISIGDVDAGTGAMETTLSVTNGALTLAQTNGLSFTSGDGTADASMTFTGTIADINAALNGLSYAPTANYNGGATLTITTNDKGNTGGGGAKSDTDTINITVSPVADTPSVTNATTNEDTQTTSGLVIYRNAADGAEVTHFKITGITNGTLYKNDGVTQITNGTFITFAEGNAGLKFTPTANFNGSGSFTVQASTSNGDAGLGGSTVNATITVNAVNDAPVLSGANNFTSITEDQTTNGGDFVSTLISGKVTDVDAGAVNGIAVTSLNSSTGTWQYSIDGGTTWSAVGAVATNSALLLHSTDKLRFVPDGKNSTTASVTFQAWDQTSGSAGSKVDATTSGGTTAFSTASATSNITVTSVNDAPTFLAPTIGSETQVNTTTTDSQTINANVGRALASDASGNFVVVWASNLQDGAAYGIYAQRFSANGTPLGTEFRVNTTTADNQILPSVAMDSAGNFVVTWSINLQDGSGYGVYAQRYNAAGVAQGGEFLVNTTTADSQITSQVAMAPNGAFVITWSSMAQDPDASAGIYAQRYDASGVPQGSEFRVNTYTTNTQQLSSVSMDGSGNFVVTWASNGQDGSGYGVYGQRFNASGVAQGSEFRVNTTTADSQLYSSVAMLSDGRFVVAYQSRNADGSYQVYLQRYAADGTTLGGETRVNTTSVTGYQPIPSVAVDAGDNITVVWNNSTDGSGAGVVCRCFNWSGMPLTDELQVNTTTSGDQLYPKIMAQASGGFVVAWGGNGSGDADGVFFQRYGTLFTGNNLTTISEDQTTNSGDLVSTLISGKVTDVDTGAVSGIAVTSLNSSTGTWQYSIDNGTTWSNVGAVATNSALLLRSTDKLRFVPDGQNSTTASVTFCAWDQTSGSAGSKVDVTTNGGTTAFSTASATSSITVTMVKR